LASWFASPEALGIQICTGVDPASVFDERFQRCALLELSSVPENSAPFAYGLSVQLLVTRTPDDDGERVRIHINRQSRKFESTPHKLLGPVFPSVVLDNQKYSSQISVDCVSITRRLKVIPSIANVYKPLPETFLFPHFFVGQTG
jgi:hypothetical protein